MLFHSLSNGHISIVLPHFVLIELGFLSAQFSVRLIHLLLSLNIVIELSYIAEVTFDSLVELNRELIYRFRNYYVLIHLDKLV